MENYLRKLKRGERRYSVFEVNVNKLAYFAAPPNPNSPLTSSVIKSHVRIATAFLVILNNTIVQIKYAANHSR